MQRIAIVEPKENHLEVLLPQIELLRNDFEVHVVAPDAVLAVDLLRDTSHLYHAHPLGSAPPRGNVVKKSLGIPPAYVKVRRVLSDIKPDVLLFNTDYTLPETALVAAMFSRYKRVQIIHNFQQFLPHSARGLYRTFDASFVLSEQVYSYIASHHPEFANLDYFLPIFFDSFRQQSAAQIVPQESDGGPLTIGVFGNIESYRRNYTGFLEALVEWRAPEDSPGLRAYLVGQSPGWVEDYFRDHHSQAEVVRYDHFVPFAEMFHLLERVDLVMFLIDGTVENAKYYNKYKITATSTMLKAFKKAGVCSSDFSVDASLADKCFYYPGAQVGAFLEQAGNGTITREQIRAKTAAYEGEALFSFENSRQRLVSAIQRVVES